MERASIEREAPLAPPIGTRDLLPPEAARRRALARAITHHLELHGYALVTTPPFELASTLERALDAEHDEVLRFVDPETGDVSAFRPDLTLQIARVVGTRLCDRPAPHRLFYEGHILRTPRGRARRQRQIAQVGAECVGVAGAAGDAEIITIASRALDAVGLGHHIEIALVPMVRTLLSPLAPDPRLRVMDALGKKNRRALERSLSGAPLPPTHVRLLVELEGLVGGLEVLDRLRALSVASIERHVASVDALAQALVHLGFEARLRFDLGEVRGLRYYTGPSFSLLAAGPGEPLGGGGRYDDLVGRFGPPLPASGFAIDLDHVERALTSQGGGAPEAPPPSVTLLGTNESELAQRLRVAGVRCAVAATTDLARALAHAQAWSLDAVLSEDASQVTIHWSDGRGEPCPRGAVADRLLARHLAR